MSSSMAAPFSQSFTTPDGVSPLLHTLKEAKRIANFEFHIMPDLDENIIDVKYKIIDEDNK